MPTSCQYSEHIRALFRALFFVCQIAYTTKILFWYIGIWLHFAIFVVPPNKRAFSVMTAEQIQKLRAHIKGLAELANVPLVTQNMAPIYEPSQCQAVATELNHCLIMIATYFNQYGHNLHEAKDTADTAELANIASAQKALYNTIDIVVEDISPIE